MSLARRGFLRLIAAAPVAAPVMAREAASRAGVAALGSGYPMCDPAVPSQNSEGDWVTSVAKKVFSKAWEDEQRERVGKWSVSILDPDLASSRSLSLSAAMRLQRERNIERYIANERFDAQRSFFRVFNREFRP